MGHKVGLVSCEAGGCWEEPRDSPWAPMRWMSGQWPPVQSLYLQRGETVAVSHGKFHLNMRKNFFPLRVTEHWNRLPREVVDSPSLEIFKTHLDKVLCSLLWVTLLRQEGWTR